MKKFTIVLMLTMVLASAARADFIGNCIDGLGDSGNSENSTLCGLALISSIPISPFITTTEGVAEDRAVYIQEVRDDAADYVAADGQDAASALLQDAINSIRAQYPQVHQLTDLQIAKVLLN